METANQFLSIPPVPTTFISKTPPLTSHAQERLSDVAPGRCQSQPSGHPAAGRASTGSGTECGSRPARPRLPVAPGPAATPARARSAVSGFPCLGPAHTGQFLSMHVKEQMHSNLCAPPQRKKPFTHSFVGYKWETPSHPSIPSGAVFPTPVSLVETLTYPSVPSLL